MISFTSACVAPVKAGAAVLTGAGALQCKFIAQMVGPDNVADITSSLGTVLNLCEAKTATTLAIPGIGTGMTANRFSHKKKYFSKRCEEKSSPE